MTDVFESQLRDPASSVAIDLAADSGAMLIALGGWMGAMGIPPFEFMGLTREWPVKRIYVRDLARSWYHAGFPGISDGPDNNAAYLKSVIGPAGVDRLTLVGNSMGGYGAMLYGMLLDASEVHAFAPHTTIATASEGWFEDQVLGLERVHADYTDKYFDLKDHLLAYRGRCVFHIHYSESDPVDTSHARRVEAADCVRLHRYGVGNHNLVKDLRLNGELEAILAGALGIVHPTGT